MIEIDKKDNFLLLKYYSNYQPTDWIDNNLESDEVFKIKGVFKVNKAILFEKVIGDFEGPEYYFKIGTLKDGYYHIDKSVFGINNDFFFYKDLDFYEEYFVAKEKVSLLRIIDSNINEPVFIGGNIETFLPIEEFKKLIKHFPTTHEVRLYREAKVTSIISNYFDSVKDKESNYKTYINYKSLKIESNLKATFRDVEIQKYNTLLDKLRTMLVNEIKYSEDQWQSEILQLILFLY